MYARVKKFVLGPDSKWEAEHIANIIYLKSRVQPGFVDFVFLAEYDLGEYQLISYWETEADWHSSYQVTWPELKRLIGDKYQWEPVVEKYQVYQPQPVQLQ